MNQDLFAAQAWKILPHTLATIASGERWKPYKHLELISKIVWSELIEGNARIIVEAPPRHGKSEFCSKWLPIWYLENFAYKSIMMASYSANLSQDFGRKVRNEIMQNARLDVKLDPSSFAADDFMTTKGGRLVATGVGGSMIGRGADLMLLDDLYAGWVEAQSERGRKNVWDWWEGTAEGRLEPNASVIIISTRWHMQDLSGKLVQKEGLKKDGGLWTKIHLPALCENPATDLLGRKIGEALCPERYDEGHLLNIKQKRSPRIWQAQYQQNPIPVESIMFKREWWKDYRELPNNLDIVQIWDCAQKPGISNDRSVCATWGFTQTDAYLINIWKGKVEAPELERLAISQYNTFRPNFVMIEDASAGSSLIQYLKWKTKIPVQPYRPKGDKVTRALMTTPTIEAGKCHLPVSAPWREDFIAEHELFPDSEYKDQVDTTSMAIDYFNKPTPIYRIRQL